MLLNKSLCKSLINTNYNRSKRTRLVFFFFSKSIFDSRQTRKEIINFRRCTALPAVIIIRVEKEKRKEEKREQRKSYPR